MARIIDNRNNLDQTVLIFDSFYSTNLKINTEAFDIVHAYFRGVCPNSRVADNFTSIFFRIAQEAEIDAMALLENIKGAPTKIKINEVLAYYLNSLKSKTSFYGIGIIPKPNQAVARNVVL